MLGQHGCSAIIRGYVRNCYTTPSFLQIVSFPCYESARCTSTNSGCWLQEEVAQKSKQLKVLYTRYRERRAEAADLQAQFQVEREDLLADYRALSQQIKLKNLAIAAFIPPAYQDLIMARCRWNEYEEQWVIAGVQAAGEPGEPGRMQGQDMRIPLLLNQTGHVMHNNASHTLGRSIRSRWQTLATAALQLCFESSAAFAASESFPCNALTHFVQTSGVHNDFWHRASMQCIYMTSCTQHLVLLQATTCGCIRS